MKTQELLELAEHTYMEPSENQSAPATQSVGPTLTVVGNATTGFVKVKDSRGRDIDGLWRRGQRFYCQLSLPGKGCRRVPLKDEQNQPIKTVTEAADAMHELRKRKRQGELPTSGHAPKFNEYYLQYLSFIENTGKKKAKTIAQEKSVLKGWAKFLGGIRLTQITKQHINLYLVQRKQKAVGKTKRIVGSRTLNYDVLALNNCLKHAKDEGWFTGKLPTEGYKRLKYVAQKRPLFTKQDFERICQVATKKNPDGTPKYRNGELLADLIRFMRTSGARVTSALATLWSDVDWAGRQVHLRKTKYDKAITVDFNNELEVVLKEMYSRRLPDTDSMFPATRGEGNVGSLRGTLEKVRVEAKLPNLHFHDTRHHFISMCVMAGIDLLTIARWVGHSGCELISKVYGHLSNEHAQRAAKRLSFESGGAAPKADETMSGNVNELSVEQLLHLIQQKMRNR